MSEAPPSLISSTLDAKDHSGKWSDLLSHSFLEGASVTVESDIIRQTDVYGPHADPGQFQKAIPLSTVASGKEETLRPFGLMSVASSHSR